MSYSSQMPIKKQHIGTIVIRTKAEAERLYGVGSAVSEIVEMFGEVHVLPSRLSSLTENLTCREIAVQRPQNTR